MGMMHDMNSGCGVMLITQGEGIEFNDTERHLAQQLSCWARVDGKTDPRIKYMSCCLGGYFQVPCDVITDHGAIPFTSNGDPITAPTGEAWMPYMIQPTDVSELDPATCTAP